MAAEKDESANLRTVTVSLLRFKGAILLFILVFISGSFARSGQPAQREPKICIHLSLFQNIYDGGQIGVSDPEENLIASRDSFSSIKSKLKGSESLISTSVIDGLFETFKPAAVDKLFCEEIAWDNRNLKEKWIIGSVSSYHIRLTYLQASPDIYRLGVLVEKGKTNSASSGLSNIEILFEKKLDLSLNDPVLSLIPRKDGDLFLLIWSSLGEPRMGGGAVPPKEIFHFVRPPNARSQVDPAFPEELRRRRLGGQIGLIIRIDESGNVRHVEIEKSLHPYLNYCAVQAFLLWTFEPVFINGKAIKAAFHMDFDFNPWLYSSERVWSNAVQQKVSLVSENELNLVLSRASNYCKTLSDLASGYVCEETIQETFYDLLSNRKWKAVAISSRATDDTGGDNNEARHSTKDAITQGAIADLRTSQGRVQFTQWFQYFDPQRDKRNEFVCDYQIFRKGMTIEEHRTILKENGRKPADPKKRLEDRRLSPLGSIYAPLRILSQNRQPDYLFWISGDEKIAGRRAWVLCAEPISGDADGILFARVWLDKETNQILKVEIVGIPLDGYEDILNECTYLNIRPQFFTTFEYKDEKGGALFPKCSKILIAYPGFNPIGATPRLKIFIDYDRYKFFSVNTESQIIR